jgi:DHA1 family bicyclomycin/chloramphenicol resistance-like MFS transporter
VTLRTFRVLLSERRFVGYVLSCGLVFAAMFAYIAASPFVLEDVHGVSAQAFSLVFGINAAGIMGLSYLGGRLVDRLGSARLLAAGLAQQVLGAIGLLLAVLLDAGLAPLLVALFVVVSSVGLVLPSASELALADHPRTAGSASALLGVCQFLFGALAAPFVGVAGSDTAVPMAIVIAFCALAAWIAHAALAGRRGVAVA